MQLLLFFLPSCGDSQEEIKEIEKMRQELDEAVIVPAVDIVRQRLEALTPAANIGHRGTGPTRKGHPFPENSLSSHL